MTIEPKHLVAAALHSAGGTMTLEQLLILFEAGDISKTSLQALIAELQADFESGPLNLVEVATGYRFQVKPEYAECLHLLADKKPPKYSRSLLETLVLILYRQPITRGEIEDVRGVAVSTHMIKTLLDRRWIKVIGHKDTPGKPALYGSTKTLLDYFGLKSLSDLPPLDEVVDLEEIGSKLNEQLSLNVEGILTLPSDDTIAEEVDEEASQEPSGTDAIDAALQAIKDLEEPDMEAILRADVMNDEPLESEEELSDTSDEEVAVTAEAVIEEPLTK